MTDELQYPIGRKPELGVLTHDQRRAAIDAIAKTPAEFRAAARGLDDKQLDTPYRPGGWTVRQVIHHLPDSHMNGFVRFKLALTEDTPTIKPYNEAEWAKLEDVRSTPIETSLTLLESMHDRWVRLLNAMSPDDFGRTVDHPEDGVRTLDDLLVTYAWHGRHHTAHVMSLRRLNNW